MRVGTIFLSAVLAACVAAECYGQPAKSFAMRLVDGAITDSQQGPPDEDLVPTAESSKDSGNALWLKRDGQLGSDALADAYACIDPRTGEPLVRVTLTPAAAPMFAELTRQNMLHRIAIVVNGKVVSAPVVREPIRGGAVEISGNLTVSKAEALAAEMLGADLPASGPEPKNCPGTAPNLRRVG